MCRLDDEVRSWREDLQGKGWFSPLELNELEARSEVPVWRSVLLTGWGLYALSLLLPGFGIVAFQRASPSFGVSAAGWEFLWLALGNGWIVELLPNLAMAMTLPLLGRTRRRMEGWVGRALGAVVVSALGFGAINFLRPLPVTVDGDLFMYGHLGTAYWVWAGSFALVATALWLRASEWAVTGPRKSFASQARLPVVRIRP